MTFSFITAQAQGTVVKDPRVSKGNSGNVCLSSSLVINRYYTDASNTPKSSTTFIDWNFWCREDDLSQYQFKKGDKVYLEGDLIENIWKPDEGPERRKLTLKVKSIKHAKD